MILATGSSVTVEKVENMGAGESGVMHCKFLEVRKQERIFFQFSLKRTRQICQPKAEGDLSMGAAWLVVYVTHHPGLATIFVGCGDCPKFLF